MKDKPANSEVLETENLQKIIGECESFKKENVILKDKLKHQENKFDVAFNEIHEGLIHLSSKGKVETVNRAFEKITGKSANELTGKFAASIALKFLDAKNLPNVLSIIKKTLKGEPVDTFEFESEGRIFEINPPTIVDKRLGITVAIRDVTERRTLISKLEKSEEQYRAIFEGLNVGLVYSDKKGKVLKVNRSLVEISAIPKEKFVGRNVVELAKELLTVNDLPKALPMIKRVLAGEKVSFEINYQNKILEITVPSIRNETQGVTTIVTDITGIKLSEKQIQEQRLDLENMNILLAQKNAALREIVRQLEQEKNRIEERVFGNVDRLLIPAILNLKKHRTSFEVKYLEMIESGLKELVSPFGEKLSTKMYNLTSRETEICNLIKNGFSSKEIGQHLNISYRTVQTQRNKIRKKLNILHRDVNLRTYLQSL
ncbi:MAG: PAS domain S-box protein [Candidatus Marinimicrobia bacterium]|nr:PAS domain S-box protein [Candidatus Neomarinimicrobiota bacterium]